MSANIRRLGNDNNLANVPHMLRNLAARIEAGDEPDPLTMLVISVTDENTPPTMYGFGKGESRLRDVGALQSCVAFLLQMVPDDGD